MTTNESITIGLVQTRVSDDIKKNLDNTVNKIREAASKGAQIICLQELYKTKYFPTDEKTNATALAESIPGETTSTMAELAKELDVVIIAPIFEADGSGRYFNTAVVIDSDGTIIGSYRKMHIPYDPFFYEKSYFVVGDLGYQTFRAKNISFGVLICYDQWFPEAARTLALQGADLIFYPSAIGHLEGDPLSKEEWHTAWENIQRSHAIANGIHVASINRVGTEGDIRFWGSSFVTDSFGRMIKRAGEEEEVLIAKIDLSMNKRIQEGWGFLKNRLPETYGAISSHIRMETPKALGYMMPAEWERHHGTWLAWPHDPLTFPNRIPKVEKIYLEIIATLSKNELVNLFVKDLKTRKRVTDLLNKRGTNLEKICFYVWPYADVWFRDYGPVFVLNKKRKKIAFVHWTFNAWGNKYKDLLKDGQIPYVISNRLRLDLFRPGIVLEGGAIDVNGKGSLLTTEQCLLNKNRNSHLSKEQIERYLANYLGVKNTIWLKGGLAGDDTDGHIDNLARFVNPRTVLCAYQEDKDDENYDTLKRNYEILCNARDQDGKKLRIIKVPMPPSIRSNIRGANTKLPASYLNFYISNEAVLIPVFKHKNDRLALRIIAKQFPKKKVVGFDCRDLIYGMGAIHCIMQQHPMI